MDQEAEDARKGAREDFRREVGEVLIANLQRLRAETGMSQEDLSLEASMVRNHVGKIENRTLIPEIDAVYRLAGALGVEPGELLTGLYWQPDDSDAKGHPTDQPPTKADDQS